MRTMTIVLCVCCVFAPSAATAGPAVTFDGTGIGTVQTSDPQLVLGPVTVDAGVDLQYCWTAIPGTGGSPVAAYRFGWNLLDPGDPFDPGWSIPVTPFDGSEVCSDVQVFLQGSPNFVLEVSDEQDGRTQITVQLQVIQPVPDMVRTLTTLKARYRSGS